MPHFSPGMNPAAAITAHDQQVIDYLYAAYERGGGKSSDIRGKDEKAAARVGMDLKQYVIGGMDPTFRELLYKAGHQMDDKGLPWQMNSGFRDNFRQHIATGFKASDGGSWHGGTERTGGYGHGQAADLNIEAAHYIAQHGNELGLAQPMPGIDPFHIQPAGVHGNWQNTAQVQHIVDEARKLAPTQVAYSGEADSHPQQPYVPSKGNDFSELKKLVHNIG
jgi:hypothetical protein